jgi:hypothetical protein
MKVIEERLLDRGCLLVLMEDEPKAIIERFRALDENFAKEVDVRDIVAKFDLEWRRSRLAKIRAHWRPNGLDRRTIHHTIADLVNNMMGTPR